MSVSLKIENVSKVYDKNIALNHVNLDVQAGEFVCLLGPSGCGKSTLLRLIAGLDTPHGRKDLYRRQGCDGTSAFQEKFRDHVPVLCSFPEPDRL